LRLWSLPVLGYTRARAPLGGVAEISRESFPVKLE